jgi:hypothetical protein
MILVAVVVVVRVLVLVMVDVLLGSQALGRSRMAGPVVEAALASVPLLLLLLVGGGMYLSKQSSPNSSVALALFVTVRGGQLNSGFSVVSVTVVVVVSVVTVSTERMTVLTLGQVSVSVSVQDVQEV